MGETLQQMRKYFDGQEKVREQALSISRQVVRASARAIAAMHRKDKAMAKKMLKEAKSGLLSLDKAIGSDPAWAKSGIVELARQEYCEARLLEGFIAQGKLIQSQELKILYRPYLMGLADVAGELRRHALDSIRANKVTKAEQALRAMEDIHELLMSFDYPDAILPGMRRKQDMVRGVLEKTRGDLTTAIRQQRLEGALKRGKK